jgi:hypothetical protein
LDDENGALAGPHDEKVRKGEGVVRRLHPSVARFVAHRARVPRPSLPRNVVTS